MLLTKALLMFMGGGGGGRVIGQPWPQKSYLWQMQHLFLSFRDYNVMNWSRQKYEIHIKGGN